MSDNFPKMTIAVQDQDPFYGFVQEFAGRTFTFEEPGQKVNARVYRGANGNTQVEVYAVDATGMPLEMTFNHQLYVLGKLRELSGVDNG